MSDDDATNVWDDVPDWGGIGARRVVRGPDNVLGASVWELQPGARQSVYHFHHGTEELLVVLRGEPIVRMQDGDHSLREGDVVAFPRGPAGGHQLRNDSDATVRVLIVAAHADPDVAEYPESGRVATILGGEHAVRPGAVEHAGDE